MNFKNHNIKETDEEKEDDDDEVDKIIISKPNTNFNFENQEEEDNDDEDNLQEVNVKQDKDEEMNDKQEKEEENNSEEEEELIDIDYITQENKTIETKFNYDKDNINLKNIDIDIMPKEDILNFLLSDKITLSSPSKNVLNTSNLNSTSFKRNSKHYKDKVQKTKNYFMYTSNNNPELTTIDFDSAYSKVVSKMNKENNSIEGNELYRVLLFNSEEESKKHDVPSRKAISTKVSFYLNKKNKTIELIQDKVKEEFTKQHTFQPKLILKEKQIQTPRKLNKFIYDQNEHIKKIHDRIEAIKEEIKSEQGVINYRPQISEKSTKIYEDKFKKSNEPIYMRLYNKKKAFEKEKVVKKFNPHAEVDENIRIKEMYMEVFKRKSKLKDIGKKIREEELKDQTQTHISSNKILLKRFVKSYRREIEKLRNICLNAVNDKGVLIPQVKSVISESNIDSNSKNITIPNQIPENKITTEQFNSLLISMNFISKEKLLITEEDKMLNLNESAIKQKEKKLVSEITENLINSDNLIDKEDLYYFLLAILNLYETCLIKVHKLNKVSDVNKELASKKIKGDVKTKVPTKEEKEKLMQELNISLLKKLNDDIISRTKVIKKYGGLDENNNFLISLTAACQINKDFNLLYINYSNNAFLNQRENHKESKTKKTLQFKPVINPMSDKLSINFRRKIQSEFEGEIPDKLKSSISTKNAVVTNGHNKIYIESLLIKKKKHEKSMAKLKEDYELKELQLCSFVPKINNIVSCSNVESKEARHEILFKLGTNHEKMRKDKTKKEFEDQSFGKECTFKPIIEKHHQIKEENKFYKEEEINQFQQRLSIGREHRKIKDSVHLRYDYNYPDEKKKKKIKESKMDKKEANKPIDQMKSTLQNVDNSSLENNDSVEENKDHHGRDSIPLLIIDVNIKPGHKKKIYVFDGDTADVLANKFSKEHNLDSDTKFKLKILIESHMSKLLMRIDEENQSVNSEISL